MTDRDLAKVPNLRVHDHPVGHPPLTPGHEAVWHPLDSLVGHFIITSPSEVDIETATVHLQGVSRVWITSLDRNGEIVTTTSSYKFLHQSQEMVTTEVSEHQGFGGWTYTVPFRFVISRWAILKKHNVPNQCLNLPPSLKLGDIYRRPSETWDYAQPNIEYFLKVEVKVRPNCISTSPRSLETSKPVTIIPCSLPLPPTVASDFPAEFIISASNTYRAFLLGLWCTMTLSMEEPPAVFLSNDHGSSSAKAVLHISIKTADGKTNGASAKGIPLNLKRLSFKVQPILRAKTFYSTIPFSKMPGQTMLTLTGPMRLKDEVMKLKEQEQKATSWQLDLPDQAWSLLERQASHRSNDGRKNSSGTQEFSAAAGESPGAWSSSISAPFEIPAGLPPTFCSVTASRQYSLIFRIKVSGSSVKDFLLEVPVQVIYPPGGAVVRQELSFSAQEAPPTFPTSILDEIFKDADVRSLFMIPPQVMHASGIVLTDPSKTQERHSHTIHDPTGLQWLPTYACRAMI